MDLISFGVLIIIRLIELETLLVYYDSTEAFTLKFNLTLVNKLSFRECRRIEFNLDSL